MAVGCGRGHGHCHGHGHDPWQWAVAVASRWAFAANTTDLKRFALGSVLDWLACVATHGTLFHLSVKTLEK